MKTGRYEMRGKVSFDHCYRGEKPDLFFREFEPLSYRAPESARPFILNCATLHRQRFPKARPLRVVDLGCSYGINSMLWLTTLKLQTLYKRFGSLDYARLTQAEAITLDRAYFAANVSRDWIDVIGHDIASQALTYAKATGLLVAAVCRDLEMGRLTHKERRVLSHVDLVVATGAIGYLSETTMRRILCAIHDSKPWVMLFVSRTLTVEPFVRALKQRGFDARVYRSCLLKQRLFANATEMASAIRAVQAAQGELSPQEEDGWVYAHPIIGLPRVTGLAEEVDRLFETGPVRLL